MGEKTTLSLTEYPLLFLIYFKYHHKPDSKSHPLVSPMLNQVLHDIL